MTASSAVVDRKARWVFLGVALAVIVLAAALSGAWYYLAKRLDEGVVQAIAAAKADGVSLSCADREEFGYPFRLGVRCRAVTIDAPDQHLRAMSGALRTAAQIYEPTRIVAELDGPLIVDAPNLPPLDIRWELAHASAKFRNEGVDHFDLAVEKPVVSLVAPAAGRRPIAQSDDFEVHARRRDKDLDFAIFDTAVALTDPAAPSVPPFDFGLNVTVAGAADWLSGKLPGETVGEALAGRSGTVRSLKIALSGASGAGAELSGPFQVSADRRLSGDLDLAVTDPRQIAGIVAATAPQLAGVANSVATAIAFVGRQENGRSIIQLTIRDGKVAAGMIPLGKIPPLQ